jgi:hypothetical protein
MDRDENEKRGRARKGPAKPAKSLAEQAAALAARKFELKAPLVLDRAEARDPKSGRALLLFRVAASSDANGPAYPLILDQHGESVDVSPELERLFNRTETTTRGAAPASAPITIQPTTNTLTLNSGETLDETITVTIPKNSGPVKADVYFLADTTGSMKNILNAVQAGANNVLAALNGLGVDMAFGVGNYKDFASGDPYAFKHQLSPSRVVANVIAAINAWAASGGSDLPEGELFALESLAVPPGGAIAWRTGSKRIIVWFGDAPGHDPICTAVSGAPAAITEASAVAKLGAEGITVLAISTATPGLDDDPKNGATGYVAKCGPPGGTPGQGTRIATKTGGAFVTGINAGNIVNTIINLVKGVVVGIQNVKLVPSAAVAIFVTAINPPGGYGPLAGDQDHSLTFRVTFTGIPCKPEVQVVTGTIDMVADGNVVAVKRVQITVPACLPSQFVYSIKFVCGEQAQCGCECTPVQPGRYATQISIHNPTSKEVEILKRFIPVVLAGAAVGREPRVSAPRAEDRIQLPAHTATMDDCCRIAELLFGAPATADVPLTIGFLEITANADISVTAVYTTNALGPGGISIQVEQVTAGRQ